MKSILVQLDPATLRGLNEVAPASSRRRSEFIRTAIRKAVLAEEYARMRKAYELAPDSESEADTWADPEEFQA